MLPSLYSEDPILDLFTYAGAPGVCNPELGAGAALWWRGGNWNMSVLSIASNGNVADSGKSDFFEPECGGIGTDCSAPTFTAQLGYGAQIRALPVAWTHTRPQRREAGVYPGNATPLAVLASQLSDSVSSFAVSGYRQPQRPGWIPSISAGWGLNSPNSGIDDAVNLSYPVRTSHSFSLESSAVMLIFSFISTTSRLSWKGELLTCSILTLGLTHQAQT